MGRVALDFGWFKIYWYSIFIFLGVLAACWVIFQETKEKKIPKEFMVDLIFNRHSNW